MKMHFNYKDLFKAPRIGFSFKMIWIGTVGFIGYWIFLKIFALLAAIVSGVSFAKFHYSAGYLNTLIYFGRLNLLGKILFLIGILGAICILLLTSVALARSAYMTLREELFYSWVDSFKWAFKKWVSIIGNYITFIILLLLFVIGALVMALIGKIPFIGNFITALFSIPYVLAGMLVIYIILGFYVSMLYAPSIIATYDEDALGAVFQSFSSLASQPFRTFWYSLLTSLLNTFFTILYILGLLGGLAIFIMLFSIVLGNSMITLVANSILFAAKLFGGNLSIVFSHLFPMANGTTPLIPVVIMGISIFLLFMSIFAYSMAVQTSGHTISYIIIEKLKDDENLLERRDEEVDKEDEEYFEESEEEIDSEEEQSEQKEESSEKDNDKKEE